MERKIRHGAARRRQEFESITVPAAAWGATDRGTNESFTHACNANSNITQASYEGWAPVNRVQKRLGTLVGLGVVGPAKPEPLGAAISIEGQHEPDQTGHRSLCMIFLRDAPSRNLATFLDWTRSTASPRHSAVEGVFI